MHTPEIIRRAMLENWRQLPDLIGSDWQDLQIELNRLLVAVEVSDDHIERERLAAEMLQLILPYDSAWQAISDSLEEIEGEGTSKTIAPQPKGVTRSASGGHLMPRRGLMPENWGGLESQPELSFGLFTPQTATSPETTSQSVTRYTDISCPRRVWVDTPRFSVVVRLTVDKPDFSAADLDLQVQADAEHPVYVHMSAAGFTLLSDPVQHTLVLADEDSLPIVFDLGPTKPGDATISFDFFQSGEPLGTVSVPIEITTYEVTEGPEPRRNQPLGRSSAIPAPNVVLHIAYEPDPSALRFTLIQDGGASWQSFPAKALNGDPAAHAAEFYRRITSLVGRSDPSADATDRHLGMIDANHQSVLVSDDIDRRLRKLGQNLWRDLIPDDLQKIYGDEREAWHDSTLLILSDEPHIPWELLWPYGKGWNDEGPWCQTMQLTRWLRRDDQGNGNVKPPINLEISPVAVIAPTDSGLPAALAERDRLVELFAAQSYDDISPELPTWSNVIDMLEGENYQWVHVAAHGNFYPQAPEADSALWLQGGEALNPDAIVGPEIENHFSEHRPAFLFNCCEVGRQGWSLTRIGGWANRLIGTGAGLYIGPHWNVTDEPAKAFAVVLYERLIAGETVGEAVRQARAAARRQGDPTWMAYSVYAHPNARVTQSDTKHR